MKQLGNLKRSERSENLLQVIMMLHKPQIFMKRRLFQKGNEIHQTFSSEASLQCDLASRCAVHDPPWPQSRNSNIRIRIWLHLEASNVLGPAPTPTSKTFFPGSKSIWPIEKAFIPFVQLALWKKSIISFVQLALWKKNLNFRASFSAIAGVKSHFSTFL